MSTTPASQAHLLATRLGYEPQDRALFIVALTHRSAEGPNNERLEFLGDSVLNLMLSERLYREFPAASEGDLSRLRARLVSEEPLAEIAQEMQLGELLLLGSGELKTGGHRRQSILADAFEALCGALYLDGGLEQVRARIGPRFESRIAALPEPSTLKDAKTRLQEFLQSRGHSLPTYMVKRTTGEPHAQTFLVSCAVPHAGVETEGEGPSRRRAEQIAAQAALQALGVHG
ncbi:MAG TPA: ribonuclease III [Steroidobacteraceae bacterium]|jgi:ribonuclease-3|nr:ribonuclease III [Steroidobacteraceae bacterium]